MSFRRFFVAAALAGAFALPSSAQDETQQQGAGSQQQAPIVIDLQGADAQGGALTGQAVLTPLPDGQVRIDHPVRDQSGQIVNQSGIARLEGDVLRAQLAPVGQGMAGALGDQQQAAPLEVQVSVDGQGRVQSQSPAFQAQGSDDGNKLRDLLRDLRERASKALRGLGERIKSGIARLKARAAELRARAAERAAAQRAAEQAAAQQAAAAEEAQQGLPLPVSQSPQAGIGAGQQQSAAE